MSSSSSSSGMLPALAALLLLGLAGMSCADFNREVALSATIERAWVDGYDLYVTYTVDPAPEGESARRAAHGLFEEASANTLSLKDAPLVRLQPADPNTAPQPGAGVLSARVLSLDDWNICWEAALDRITPPDPMLGLKGRMAGYKVVVYRESDGTPQLILAREKPPWIPIDGALKFRVIAEELSLAVEAFMEERYPEGHERFLVFRTNPTDTDLLPFLALDRKARTPILFTFERPVGQPPGKAESIIGKTIRGTGLIFSSLYNTLIRPVTSLHMLFDALVDITVDITYPLRRGRMPRGEPPPLENQACMDTAEWEDLLSDKLGLPENNGTVSFQVGGPTFFEEAMKSMFAAERSIAIRTYIFDTDDYAVSMADFLKTRSEEVDTRIVFDQLGSSLAAGARPEHLPDSHQAPDSMQRYLREDSDIEVRVRPNPWFMGDHSKTWIMDGETVYLGGINIGREYRTEWHDMMAKVEGPIVDIILKEFSKAWNYSGAWGDLGLLGSKAYSRKNNRDKPGYPMRILWTKPGTAQILKAQLAAIRNAQQRILVENAYLSSTEVINELIRARHRGVDVKVILPEQGNHGVMNANNRVVANHLLDNGVGVYLYPGMSHVKAALFDGWACLGSANFDRLSLRFNMELNIATSHPEAVEELMEELFLPDLEASRQLEKPLKVRSMDILSRHVAAALL